MMHDEYEQRDRRREQYGDNNAQRDKVLSEFAPTFAFRPISASSAHGFWHSVSAVVSGPIPGATLAAATTNPAPEAYQSVG
jgi:hypothetical protein